MLILFIYIAREIPRDVFMKIRNENMRKNLIDEIREKNP